jgi:hypothetical protein
MHRAQGTGHRAQGTGPHFSGCNIVTLLHQRYKHSIIYLYFIIFVYIVWQYSENILINPLTPELNPSAKRCLPRFFTGDFNF